MEQYFRVYKRDFKKLRNRYESMLRNKQKNETASKIDKPINTILELTILSLLRDRLKSSMKRKYFQNEMGRSYVIMTYDEITKTLRCTGRSCTHALKDLANNNFITTKRIYNGPNKYYLNGVDYKNDGYYKFLYSYFEEFDNDLKKIYAYMIIKDLVEMSKHETEKRSSDHKFVDHNGDYYTAKNIKDISTYLNISAPTCGKLIRNLEDKGYVLRKRRRNRPSRIYLLK